MQPTSGPDIGMWCGVHWLGFAATDTDTSFLLLSSTYLAWLPKSQTSSKKGELGKTYNRLIRLRYTGIIAYSAIANKVVFNDCVRSCVQRLYTMPFDIVNVSMISVVVTEHICYSTYTGPFFVVRDKRKSEQLTVEGSEAEGA